MAAHDVRGRAEGLTGTLVRLSRHAGALSFAAATLFAAMMALEFFYFRRLSGGLPSLDMRMTGFTPDDGMAWLTALGRRGSEILIVWHYLTFGLVFPALLSLALATVILAVARRLPRFRAMPEDMQAIFALMFVLPYTLADYAENIAVTRLLSDFLSANPDSLSLASGLVVTKFVFGLVPFAVIAVLLLLDRKRRA